MSYLHILDGRMRIKVPEVKRSHVNAVKVEDALRRLNGVHHAKANTTTGNVLVLFDSDLLDHQLIVDHIRRIGFLNLELQPQEPTFPVPGISQFLVRSMAEVMVERAIGALL